MARLISEIHRSDEHLHEAVAIRSRMPLPASVDRLSPERKMKDVSPRTSVDFVTTRSSNSSICSEEENSRISWLSSSARWTCSSSLISRRRYRMPVFFSSDVMMTVSDSLMSGRSFAVGRDDVIGDPSLEDFPKFFTLLGILPQNEDRVRHSVVAEPKKPVA